MGTRRKQDEGLTEAACLSMISGGETAGEDIFYSDK